MRARSGRGRTHHLVVRGSLCAGEAVGWRGLGEGRGAVPTASALGSPSDFGYTSAPRGRPSIRSLVDSAAARLGSGACMGACGAVTWLGCDLCVCVKRRRTAGAARRRAAVPVVPLARCGPVGYVALKLDFYY